MDYDLTLQQTCPAAIVREVQARDLRAFPASDPVDLAFESGLDRACINAIIVWPTPRIRAGLDEQVVRNWMSGLMQYQGDLSDSLRVDIRDALLRLDYRADRARLFFTLLRRLQIDIRPQLLDIVPVNWAFNAKPNAAAAQTWNYFLYRAGMGDTEAYQALAAHALSEPTGNVAEALYIDLQELGTPEARSILEKQRNDTRMMRSPGGRVTPLGDVITVLLDLGAWSQ